MEKDIKKGNAHEFYKAAITLMWWLFSFLMDSEQNRFILAIPEI